MYNSSVYVCVCMCAYVYVCVVLHRMKVGGWNGQKLNILDPHSLYKAKKCGVYVCDSKLALI